VNRPGAVHRDQGHEPALHQVDEVQLTSRAQHVRAHHQDARRAPRLRFRKAPADRGDVRVAERGR